MAIVVRAARHHDLAAVSALLGATWHATYDAIYGPDRVADITRRWHSVEALSRILDQARAAFLVAVEGEELLGTISISTDRNGASSLQCLYVAPGHQGRGIGSMLLDRGLSKFPMASRVSLEVEPANTKAMKFYERHGFAVTGATDECGCAGDRIKALVMTRELARL